MPQQLPSSHIKFLYPLLILVLLVPNLKLAKSETQTKYQTYQGEIIFNTSAELVEVVKIAPPPPPIKKVTPKSNGKYKDYSCVHFAFQKAGLKMLGIGAAKNYPVNSLIPAPGAIIIFYGGRYGHMGYVTGVNGSIITYDEGNADYHGLIKIGSHAYLGQSNIKGYYIR